MRLSKTVKTIPLNLKIGQIPVEVTMKTKSGKTDHEADAATFGKHSTKTDRISSYIRTSRLIQIHRSRRFLPDCHSSLFRKTLSCQESKNNAREIF
jgi:hypothetical protein